MGSLLSGILSLMFGFSHVNASNVQHNIDMTNKLPFFLSILYFQSGWQPWQSVHTHNGWLKYPPWALEVIPRVRDTGCASVNIHLSLQLWKERKRYLSGKLWSSRQGPSFPLRLLLLLSLPSELSFSLSVASFMACCNACLASLRGGLAQFSVRGPENNAIS